MPNVGQPRSNTDALQRFHSRRTGRANDYSGAFDRHPVWAATGDTGLVLFDEPSHDGKRRGFEYKPVWRRIKIDLGTDDLRFHDLRHEAVSRFVELGLSDQEVAAISGHQSMHMLRRQPMYGRISQRMTVRGQRLTTATKLSRPTGSGFGRTVP